jgi:hypothetical protein
MQEVRKNAGTRASGPRSIHLEVRSCENSQAYSKAARRQATFSQRVNRPQCRNIQFIAEHEDQACASAARLLCARFGIQCAAA